MTLMSFPAKDMPAPKKQAPLVDAGKPLGVVNAWAKENGEVALSAGNYDTTNAFMILSLDIAAAEQLVTKLTTAISKAKSKE